jgi:hypothetical protein
VHEAGPASISAPILNHTHLPDALTGHRDGNVAQVIQQCNRLVVVLASTLTVYVLESHESATAGSHRIDQRVWGKPAKASTGNLRTVVEQGEMACDVLTEFIPLETK